MQKNVRTILVFALTIAVLSALLGLNFKFTIPTENGESVQVEVEPKADDEKQELTDGQDGENEAESPIPDENKQDDGEKESTPEGTGLTEDGSAEESGDENEESSDGKDDGETPNSQGQEENAGPDLEVTEEPSIDDPVIDEPVVEQPTIDEPVADDPIIEEPVVEEQTVDDHTDPVIDEPVIEEPIEEEPFSEEPVLTEEDEAESAETDNGEAEPTDESVSNGGNEEVAEDVTPAIEEPIDE